MNNTFFSIQWRKNKHKNIKYKMYKEILLNGPNIVGYIRLLLVFTGCLFFNKTIFITFISLSAILDMFGKENSTLILFVYS